MRPGLALVAGLALACSSPRARPASPEAPERADVIEAGTVDWGEVRAELVRRVEIDQQARLELVAGPEIDPELGKRLLEIDRENTAWIKTLVRAHGWPTESQVGEKGAGDAWLLVQHADQDVEFQEECVGLLREAVAEGEAQPQHLAYLEDRVATHRGRPQRYGTQFVEKDGKLEPYLLEDPERVDAWRAEVGLGTLEEYREMVRKELGRE